MRDGRVSDAAGVEAFVRSLVRLQAAEADARTVAAAALAAAAGDLAGVCAADAALFATKAPEELRTAATSTGARVLAELAAHDEARMGLVGAFLDAVRAGETPGTHAAALGVAGAALGVPPETLVASALFATANTVLSAAMRLLPVSHRDVQGALHRLRPAIAELAREAVARAGEPPSAFHPLQEIASMRHKRSSVRLFTS